MLVKVKAVVLAFTVGALMLIGLVSPSLASAGSVQMTASARAELPCSWKVQSSSSVSVYLSPSRSVRIAGVVNRTWMVSPGTGCRSGYAKFVNGGKYFWLGKPGTRWAAASFTRAGKRVTGYVPAPTLFRSCGQATC